MNRILLINNKAFFDKHNVYTITSDRDIPNKSAILFIGSHTHSMDNLAHITKYFNAIHNKPYNYVIIVGKGDGILRLNAIPKNIKYIYATNTNYVHPIIKFLPMGSDFRSVSSFSKAHNTDNKPRDILCYCNFSINTHKIREHIYNLIKNKGFITFENMGTFMNYSISRDTFFERLGNSKFTICPRGNAPDTFRLYDSLYSGSIPIVVREQFHNLNLFIDLPILFLEKTEDFSLLTKELLEEQYSVLSKKIKPYYEQLDFSNLLRNSACGRVIKVGPK